MKGDKGDQRPLNREKNLRKRLAKKWNTKLKMDSTLYETNRDR